MESDVSYGGVAARGSEAAAPRQRLQTDGAAPAIRGVAADVVALLARWWREAPDYQRFVYKVSLGIFLAGACHAILWAVLGGSWTETISWRKPTLFLLSSGVTVAMCTLVTNYLAITRRQGWQLGLCIVTPGLLVGALISLQQFRGTRSHFNFFQSTFDTVVAGTIAFIISLCVPAVAILAVLTFRALRPGVPRPLALALRSGMVLINVSFLLGLVTILNGVTNGLLFTIQVPSVIGSAGTTKVAHGAPLHGIQVFLLILAMLSYTAWSERRRLAVLAPAVAGYAGIVAVFVFQSFAGREPFEFAAAARIVLALSIVLLLSSIGIAVIAFITAIRRGAQSDILPSYPWPPASPGGLPDPGGVRGFFDAAFWKTAAALVLLVGGTVMVSAIIGLQLSPTLVFTRTAWIDAEPAAVWAAVNDYAAEPSWRRELTSVQPVGERRGRTLWREQYWSHQKIDLETVGADALPGQRWRLVRQMFFHALPVLGGAVRVVELTASGRGTQVTMTEEKVVRVPPFRTWARLFVLPQLSTATADRYLNALGVRFATTPQFQ